VNELICSAIFDIKDMCRDAGAFRALIDKKERKEGIK
jgi:hypothetical protein